MMLKLFEAWTRAYENNRRALLSVKLVVDIGLPKKKIKLPWREACPPNHHDDRVDSDQEVIRQKPPSGGNLCDADSQEYRGTSLIRNTPPP